MASDPQFWKKLHAKIAGPPVRYAVHAYHRQVWAGTSPDTADRIIAEYALLGQRAVKYKMEAGDRK